MSRSRRKSSCVSLTGGRWQFLAPLAAALAIAAPYALAADVDVTAAVSGTAEPGATLTLTGTCTINDGSALQGYEWSQSAGTPAAIDDTAALSTAVELASSVDFKHELIEELMRPSITEDELPPGAALPPGIDLSDFKSGLQNRSQVVGINPFALEEAGHVEFTFTCTTDSGPYSATVAVPTALPWAVSTGLQTVPVEVPVLLYGKCTVTDPDDDEVCVQDYNWTLVAPPGSSATLEDADTRAPWLVPDWNGVYEVLDTVSGTILDVYADRWKGMIDPTLTLYSVLGIGSGYTDGRPVADSSCLVCHNDGEGDYDAPDKFTPWRETGHAEIFTQNINAGSGGHYSSGCFSCHTVGYNPDADNNGFDDQPAYSRFLSEGYLNSSPDAWEYMLDDLDANGHPLDPQFPEISPLTRFTNVQCENCHGPQQQWVSHGFSGPDGDPNPARVSISSDVCASCHGEPARHARFQQWQLSGHGNYELAIREGDSGNCSRCHTGNGFIQWNTELHNDPEANVTVNWDEDSVHPQTCVACHEPHETGTTSGSADTNANVRVDLPCPSDVDPTTCPTQTLVAGFEIAGAGKGAICMTCHNSRRGPVLHEDDHWNEITSKTQTPHPPTQADLLQGRNAFFVDPGAGKHAFINDTCVNCHMEKTLPPPIISYNRGGTNHTFAASPDVCVNCHESGYPNAEGVQSQVGGLLSQLYSKMGNGWENLIAAVLPVTLPAACGSAVLSTAGQIDSVAYNTGRGLTITVNHDGGSTCSTAPADIMTSLKFEGKQKPKDGKGKPRQYLNLEEVSLTAPTATATLPAGPGNDGALLKARWNWTLVYNDSGLGVHNPDFSVKALQGAINAVGNVGF